MFNLTVQGCPEYLANGVLTHNCDTLFYSVSVLPLVAPWAGGNPADAKPTYRDPTQVDEMAARRLAAQFARTAGFKPGVSKPW